MSWLQQTARELGRTTKTVSGYVQRGMPQGCTIEQARHWIVQNIGDGGAPTLGERERARTATQKNRLQTALSVAWEEVQNRDDDDPLLLTIHLAYRITQGDSASSLLADLEWLAARIRQAPAPANSPPIS